MPRIAPARLPEGGSQAVFVGRHDNQMHMVRHQAQGPDICSGLAAPFRQQPLIDLVIAGLNKGLHTADAALGHMMRNARYNQPCGACHERPR
jgi:hypothetical protein